MAYLWYILRHKWYVFLGCCKYKLYWRGLLHDLSKFRPSEWFPYKHFFYGKHGKNNQETCKDNKPTLTDDDGFDLAWLYHQKRNKHHWQYWILPSDNGKVTCLPMPEKYWKEMIADWYGAGMAIQGRSDPAPWYVQQKDKIQLHPTTRKAVEEALNIGVALDCEE